MIILNNEESSAIEALERAVTRTVLGLEPQVGPISWMIPISLAIQTGGIDAAYACYEQIRDQPGFFIDRHDLIPFFYQLNSVKEFDLAYEVLKLNLHVFPDDPYTLKLLTMNSDQ